MPNDEAAFAKTLEGLSEEEKAPKLLEFRASKADDYREKLNIQNRILEKEGFEFKEGKWEKKPQAAAVVEAPKVTLSPVESVLLAKADIAPEDVNEVLDYANFRKLSITDALKDNTLKTILNTRVEERKTAAATIVSPAGRQAPRETAESILDSASKGQLPDSDEGVNRLVQSRIEAKIAKKQK